MRKIMMWAALMLPCVTQADVDAERDALARLAYEIAQLEVLIKQAESQAQSSARVSFNYDALRNDLAMIRGAIKTHIQAPRTSPRTLAPLQGDYRQ